MFSKRDISQPAKQAHIIVCGNEKGGSGKTTTAMHIIAHLLNAGHKVASIDLDSRQLSLTRYLENRKNWSQANRVTLPMPMHHHLPPADHETITQRENAELAGFSKILSEVEATADYLVIDTPGHDGYLMRLSHSMADTLVTPLNDSYIDFDVLGRIDPYSGEIKHISHYAAMVREARKHRRSVDNGVLDWIVVRNRLSNLNSKNKIAMFESLKGLSMQLGCRLADGITERVVFREMFPIGLTVLDKVSEEEIGSALSMSQLSARQEVRQLIQSLKLPVDDIGMRRAEARKKWLDNADENPLSDSILQ